MAEGNLRTVHLKFSENEITEIDEWRDKNRIRTRSEAIRQMIRRTLEMSNNTNDYVQANYLSDIKSSGISQPPFIYKNSGNNNDLTSIIHDLINKEVKLAMEKLSEKNKI